MQARGAATLGSGSTSNGGARGSYQSTFVGRAVDGDPDGPGGLAGHQGAEVNGAVLEEGVLRPGEPAAGLAVHHVDAQDPLLARLTALLGTPQAGVQELRGSRAVELQLQPRDLAAQRQRLAGATAAREGAEGDIIPLFAA